MCTRVCAYMLHTSHITGVAAREQLRPLLSFHVGPRVEPGSSGLTAPWAISRTQEVSEYCTCYKENKWLESWYLKLSWRQKYFKCVGWHSVPEASEEGTSAEDGVTRGSRAFPTETADHGDSSKGKNFIAIFSLKTVGREIYQKMLSTIYECCLIICMCSLISCMKLNHIDIDCGYHNQVICIVGS